MNNKKFICIHGHFYQPPRENPWLESVERQPSATPFHDWNEKVNAECYAPNTAARIMNNSSQIIEIMNNYEFISFNFGPTLLDWLAKADPRTTESIKAADRASLARLGHGNAIAQVYNHIIMPLASPLDKVIQVKWGIADFEKFFNRRPEGMWLAEAAVDLKTLDVLADEGIKFTILSPAQAAAVRPDAYAPWHDVRGARIDPKRPYFVTLPSGRKFALFFYDGPLSQAIAFEGILNDGAFFASRIKGVLDKYPAEAQLAHMATDGESYGHHHRFGEMALAYALKTLHDDPEVTITNYASFLADNPPTWEVQIVEPSSWSCSHGVERWRSDCGDGGHGAGWSLAWRAPLRKAFDDLRDDVAELLTQKGKELLKDPIAARIDYINFLQSEPGLDSIHNFIKRHQLRELSSKETNTVMKLMECCRFAMYTFTSCGWFFDDISRLEPVQNMRYAARAIELANSITRTDRLQKIKDTLNQAISNYDKLGTGRNIWQLQVEENWIAPEQLVIEVVLPAIIKQKPIPSVFDCYTVEQTWGRQAKKLNMNLFSGTIALRHNHLLSVRKYSYIIFYMVEHDILCMVGPWRTEDEAEKVWQHLQEVLAQESPLKLRHEIINSQDMKQVVANELTEDARVELAKSAFSSVLDNYRKSINVVYDETRETMRVFREMNLPLPRIFITLAEVIIADQLLTGLEDLIPGHPIPNRLNLLAMQAKAMGLEIGKYQHLVRTMESILELEAENLYKNRKNNNDASLELLVNVLDLAQAFGITLNLWKAQNYFHLFTDSLLPHLIPEKFIPLGVRLGFAPETMEINQ